MKDEIKEIFDIWADDDGEIVVHYIDKNNNKQEYKIITRENLLDYITNLQDTLKDREEYCYGLETQITNLQEENVRLNNIINELEAMFDGDLDGFFTINEKGSCNEIIEVIQNYKDKLKELKEGK